MKQYVCISIGDTEVKYGVLDENGLFLTKDKMPTEAPEGGPSLPGKVVGVVREYLKLWKVDGVCVSMTGMVDVEKREIFYSTPPVPDCADTKAKVRMESESGPPREVKNDANCAGLPEAVPRAAAGSRPTLCFTVGIGVGGYVIINGNVYHGFGDSACKIGYIHMEGSDFQTLRAASILASRMALAKEGPVHMWNGFHIFELAKAGDSVYIQAIDNMYDVLEKEIPNICYVINPQVVVLGGGVIAQEKYLRPRIQTIMDRYLVSSIREKTALALAQHGNDAGMKGVYYHFKERQG